MLPSVAEEVVIVTERLLENLSQPPLSGDTKEMIRTQIISLGDPEHRVREIVREYCRLAMCQFGILFTTVKIS